MLYIMLACQILTTLILLIASIIGLKSFKADHERRRKQATIEYLSNLRPKYTKCNNALIKKYGTDPIGTEITKEIIKDDTLWSQLAELLGMFEHLAVAVDVKIFDIAILKRMSSQYLVAIFDRWQIYIYEIRKDLKKQGAYIAFEELVKQLKSLDDPPNSAGKIKHS